MSRFLLVLSAILLASCATPEKPPAAAAESPPQPIAVAAPAESRAKARVRRPAPIPVRPLNVKTDCTFRDETGYAGAMKLAVEEARVHAFAARVRIPGQGSCRFDMRDFRQTREMPNVELSHLRDRCIVRVWEQGERVTVAFQQCQKMCSGGAWERLWPILTDRRDGSCA
jgi:hypothetical protein